MPYLEDNSIVYVSEWGRLATTDQLVSAYRDDDYDEFSEEVDRRIDDGYYSCYDLRMMLEGEESYDDARTRVMDDVLDEEVAALEDLIDDAYNEGDTELDYHDRTCVLIKSFRIGLVYTY